MPWEVQIITEDEKRFAEALLGQIRFHYHTPVRFEWSAGGVVVDGWAGVNVIVRDTEGHYDSHYLQVPVKWIIPPGEIPSREEGPPPGAPTQQ